MLKVEIKVHWRGWGIQINQMKIVHIQTTDIVSSLSTSRSKSIVLPQTLQYQSLSFSSIQRTWQKVEKINTRFLYLLIPLGTQNLTRQGSSLMLRRHITVMLFTARIYFINHCRWAELLCEPNTYMQTKPSLSAHCSWVVAQRFSNWRRELFVCFFPWIAKTWRTWQLRVLDYTVRIWSRSATLLPNKPLLSFSITSLSTLLFGSGPETPLIPLSPCPLALHASKADSCWQTMTQNGSEETEL